VQGYRQFISHKNYLVASFQIVDFSPKNISDEITSSDVTNVSGWAVFAYDYSIHQPTILESGKDDPTITEEIYVLTCISITAGECWDTEATDVERRKSAVRTVWLLSGEKTTCV